MEIRGTNTPGIMHRVVSCLFFCAMFAMPWINEIRATTFLLIILGIILLVRNYKFKKDTNNSPVLAGLFVAYYALQVIAYCIYPTDLHTRVALEQKAALIFVPILIYLISSENGRLWGIGIKGFVYGNIAATIYCLVCAIIKYTSGGNINVFFYHQYAAPLGLSAIYFSLYLLVALCYILTNAPIATKNTQWQLVIMRCICVLFFANLLLLSSKIMIAMGLLLLLAAISSTVKTRKLKIFAVAMLTGVCILVAVTKNPIRTRYTNISYDNYTHSISANNFKDFPFDGLSIRLVLWRLGSEIINEHSAWFTGIGGERYHEFLNVKLAQYKLYSGNPLLGDIGYKDYNMHSQYMENYIQYGVIGLGLLITIVSYTLWNAIIYRHVVLAYMILMFFISFFTESLLETQAGIILFTIIISGEWVQLRKKTAEIAR